jgi:hypothetical protein
MSDTDSQEKQAVQAVEEGAQAEGAQAAPIGNKKKPEEQETMSIEQLNTELNDSIQKLKKNLQSKLNGLTFEDNSIQNICAKISELNLLGDFDRSFYSSLNNYFKKNGNPSNLMDGQFFFQIIYSQIINGKYGTDWPSESQKKLIQESLGSSVGESISSAFGFGSKGGKKIIKNKRKYIRRKNIKK